ncbi:MAG: T9SS type A sorting domain-containing protein [Dysgonamonadaceae bacterium]|jgi:hypothetical protein|nr:T9SS type A sorting domain-containing protein [Dysgonamonadaceae bacterium]
MKHYSILFFFGLFLSLPLSKAGDFIYSLDSKAAGEWKVYPVKTAGSNTAALSAVDYNSSEWIPATVPGTFFVDYVNAGLEADPNYGDNIYRVDESKYNQPFWYRTVFDVPQHFTREKIWLNLEGTNKKATVYLNGQTLGVIKGHVQRAKYDVSEIVSKTQKNVLLVRIDIPKQRNRREQEGWDNFTNYAMPTYMASASWDWMPYVPGLNCGITNNVYLSNSGSVTLEDPWIRTELPDKNQAFLSFQTQLNNTSAQSVDGKLEGTILPGNIRFSKDITIPANSAQTVRLTKDEFAQLTVDNPKLWWPNGYGNPDLYLCQVEFSMNGTVSDEREITFGIKKYEYKTENTALTFYINGEKILLKGGNWGMSEYLLRCRDDEYETKIKLHADMNYNTIRCWTGCVTDEEFYQYCDRYGILVWDDFWLANAFIGGVDDETEFCSNAVDKVKRLRNHPCIALWCGANESVPPGNLDDNLKAIIAEYDGNDRRYQPNSRQGGGLTGSGFWNNFPARDYLGDGIPSWGGDFGDWNKKRGMRTELGMAAFTTFESLREFIPESHWWSSDWSKNEMWNNHFFGESASAANPESYFNTVKKNYGASSGIEEFCEKSQYLNLEIMKAIYEGWNEYLWNDATGILIWMSQSAYPSFVWQTYDYYYDATGAYWGAKKGCEPLHIQWNCVNNSVKIINTTLQDYAGLQAQATVYNSDGSIYEPLSMQKTVGVLSKEAKECFILSSSGDNSALSDFNFIRLELRDQQNNLLSDNFYWRNMKNQDDYTALNHLPKADLSTNHSERREDGQCIIDYQVTNNSASVAFGIRLRVVNEQTGERILPVFMKENYFTLMPGETKTMQIQFAESLIGDAHAAVLTKQYGWKESATAINNRATGEEMFPLTIYPNPLSGHLYLKVEKKLEQIKIRDISGTIVYSGPMETAINVSCLPQGFYLLQGISGRNVYAAKFIKE